MWTQNQYIIAAVVVLVLIIAGYFGYKQWKKNHPSKAGFHGPCPCGCAVGCQCAAGCQCRKSGLCPHL
jgi:predicted transporter